MLFSSYCGQKNRKWAEKVDLWTSIGALLYVFIAAAVNGELGEMAVSALIALGAIVAMTVAQLLLNLVSRCELAAVPAMFLFFGSIFLVVLGALGVEEGRTTATWRLIAGFALIYVYYQVLTAEVEFSIRREERQ